MFKVYLILFTATSLIFPSLVKGSEEKEKLTKGVTEKTDQIKKIDDKNEKNKFQDKGNLEKHDKQDRNHSDNKKKPEEYNREEYNRNKYESHEQYKPIRYDSYRYEQVSQPNFKSVRIEIKITPEQEITDHFLKIFRLINQDKKDIKNKSEVKNSIEKIVKYAQEKNQNYFEASIQKLQEATERYAVDDILRELKEIVFGLNIVDPIIILELEPVNYSTK